MEEIPYSQYETLTENQKNGVIICPDYPVGGGNGHTHSIEPTYTRIYAWQRTA